MTYRELILRKVNESTGIKGVDLCLSIMSHNGPGSFNHEQYMLDLDEILKSGEIIELEYTLPDMEYRIKSLFFPKGTSFSFNQLTTGHKD